MTIVPFLQRWTLPTAMVAGILLYALLPSLFHTRQEGGTGIVTLLFPLTLFITLFTTFARVDFHAMRLRPWHAFLLLAQLLLVALLLLLILLLPTDNTLSDTALHAPARMHPTSGGLILASLLTCAIAPCAAAAPVVTAKLGGNLPTMTTFMILSNLLCVITIPLIFPLLPNAPAEVRPTSCGLALAILQRLAAVLLLPLLCGWFTRHYLHSLYRWITRHPSLSFHTWCLSLMMISGITLRNIVNTPYARTAVLLIALGSLAICLLQYLLGAFIGRHTDEFVNARQGMFQKNTALAIYIATTFLHPLASIGAGCYVLWQNIVNAYELSQQPPK